MRLRWLRNKSDINDIRHTIDGITDDFVGARFIVGWPE
jgi:hypothetical protein